MKICKIYIKGFQQFQDVELDFTNPETGEPLDKVCFIGRNGTGKSKILRMIIDLFNSHFSDIIDLDLEPTNYNKILVEFLHGEKRYIFVRAAHLLTFLQDWGVFEYSSEIFDIFFKASKSDVFSLLKDKNVKRLQGNHYPDNLLFEYNSHSLFTYCPSESEQNGYVSLVDVPKTNVSEAYSLNSSFPFYHEVSPAHITSFWKNLLFNLLERRDEREAFENKQENLDKTKKELLEEFNLQSQDILERLNRVWNKILDKSGLEFDYKNAKIPYQLDENLKAYIKLKKTGETIKYSELSTGIRNYIFRLGHIFSLYFNREIDRGFLLVDEPENSLFPDFLFDLVETYQEVIKDKRGQNNTQMFFATHSPIIAAQFKPYERIILDWNDDATVNVRKGISPVGDDPNDILTNDFELENLMGPEGRKMWNEYISLKKKSIRETDKDKKDELIHQIEKIGSLYNFS